MRYGDGAMHAPGPLVASGRDSEIFEYGPNLVLRRARNRRSMEKEAKVMGYVAQHGYPVPRVDAAALLQLCCSSVAGSMPALLESPNLPNKYEPAATPSLEPLSPGEALASVAQTARSAGPSRRATARRSVPDEPLDGLTR